jgi:hypothetical protein
VGDKVRQCAVFVSPVSTRHDGSEDLSDLLCNDDPYLSVEERGTYLCLPKDAIAVAWVEQSPPSMLEQQGVPATENQVLVKLTSGRKLRGAVRYLRHPDSSRLVDYLNAEPQFFTLHQKKLALVNRRFVTSVALLRQAEQLERPKRKRTALRLTAQR